MTNQPGNRIAAAVYILATGLAVSAFAALWWSRYFLPAVILSCQISGYGALGFLAVTLSIASIVRIAGWLGLHIAPNSAAALVKHCGRCSALLSLLHGGIVLTTYLNFDWIAVWRVTYLRSGAVAATILALLLATSSKRFNRLLDWQLSKPLHRLAYVAAALVLHHLLLSPFASRSWTLFLFGGLAAILLVRLVPGTNRSSTS